MEDNLNRKKLSFGTKLGYGLGAAGDSIPYNLFYTYFVFYLTNVAGISPAIAGTISMISIIWSACVDPVVGFMSDNSRNSKGRRIPMMSKSIWPLAVVMIFLYIAPTGLSGGLLVAYFIFACILLWTFYSTYGVPYGALGAELTNDYNERNILRLFTGLCSYPFVAVVNSGVMAVIAFATARGVSYERSWTVAAAAVAAVAVICCSISVIKLKGKEPESHINTETERIKISGIFKEYIPILKQKTFRRLMWYGLVWIIGYNTFSTVGVYIMTYCAGLDEAAQSKFWLIYTVIAVICTPIPVFVANKIGKKPTLFGFSAVFVIGAVIFYITGINSFGSQIAYGAVVAFSTSAFWGLFYSTVYDCSEIIEFKTGRRNEGGILALAQFIQKLGGAFAAWFVGILLTMFGYTGNGLETGETIHGILTIGTLIPAVLVAVSLLLFTLFRLNRKKYEAIINAIELRKNGQEPDTSEFEDVL